jgi:peroxiredoxin
MVAVTSTMLPLGEPAPGFSLSDPAGRLHSLADFVDAPALVVIFLCNHCPYVRHISRELAGVTQELLRHGVAVVGISANDVVTHPEDAPDRMVVEAERNGYAFPYLYDETQEVAKAYRAACTPDFYVFDGERKLVYRGQFDDSRPSNHQPVTGRDLVAAVTAVLAGGTVPSDQRPSIGCNIEWRPGSTPEYVEGV